MPVRRRQKATQLRHHSGGQGQEATVAGVHHGLDVPDLPGRALQGKDHDRFVGGVDHSLDHPVFRRDPAPKPRSARYPTRSIRASTVPGRSALNLGSGLDAYRFFKDLLVDDVFQYTSHTLNVHCNQSSNETWRCSDPPTGATGQDGENE